MYKTKAYSAASATSPLAGTTIVRRDALEHDVEIEILFCGICHSDLHSVRNEWSEFMPTVYPIVPGHEIVGRVSKVGSAVTKYKPGDVAAVGVPKAGVFAEGPARVVAASVIANGRRSRGPRCSHSRQGGTSPLETWPTARRGARLWARAAARGARAAAYSVGTPTTKRRPPRL